MSEPVMQRLKISSEGIILIKSFEGFRPRAVRRDDGKWVIGYGHTLSAREGASVSEADAELLLQYDLIPVAQAVNEGVAQVAGGAVNQHQFDALASFAFSIGVDRFRSSDVLSRLIAGSAGEAADAIVNWPEPALPEASLRRRAAERALFVADPAWPVALSDLLSAPLPPPPVATTPPSEARVIEPDGDPHMAAASPDIESDADASRQAAVSALLGEMNESPSPVELGGADLAPPSDDAAEPTPSGSLDGQPSTFPDDSASDPPVAAEAPDTAEPIAAEPDPVEPGTSEPDAVVEPAGDAPDGTPADLATADRSDASDIVTPFAPEPETELTLTSAVRPEDLPAAISTPEVAEPVTFDPESASVPTVLDGDTRFSPYVGPLVGPLEAAQSEAVEVAPPDAEPTPFVSPEPITPVFPTSDAAAQLDASTTSQPSQASDDGTGFPPLADEVRTQPAAAEASVAAAPVAPVWPTLTAESEPRADGELLVLTPLPEESVFPAPRLVWPHGEIDPAETPPLFEDDGSLRLGGSPLLRPEPLEAFTPKRVAWGEMGAFLLMGGFGLVSFGMAMAAFRRASQSAGSDELTIIAIVLAVFGAACVGVSAYNLYRRWGRKDQV